MIWTTKDDELPPVVVTVPSQEALLTDLRSRLTEGRGFSIATINLDHVVKLNRNTTFRRAYADHSHVTADGRPIVWLSRLAGSHVRLVTGSDLVDPLAALCCELSAPVAMIGSTDPVLAKASDVLVTRHPGLPVVLRIAPAMGFDPEGPEADRIIEQLQTAQAKLCFVALGAPTQEIFVARAVQALPGVGFASIGAGLDFVAGEQMRAPRWVRAFAAEWLWRLIRDPRRLAGRYAACAVILPGLLGRAVTSRAITSSPRGMT